MTKAAKKAAKSKKAKTKRDEPLSRLAADWVALDLVVHELADSFKTETDRLDREVKRAHRRISDIEMRLPHADAGQT